MHHTSERGFMGKLIIDFKENNFIEWKIEGKNKKDIMETANRISEIIKN